MADLNTRIVITAQDNASTSFKSVESSVNSVKNSVNAFMGMQFTSYLSSWVTSLKDTAENYQTLNARLKLVITDSNEYKQAQKDLFDIAQRSRGNLEGTIGLYTSITEKIKELGGGSKETAAVVETVNKAIALTSMGIQQDSAALLQFKQAINSSTLAGDELRSILENSPGLAKAMADGLGVPVGALKQLGAEGKLTSAEIINAILKMQGAIDEKFKSMPLTIGQAVTRVNNSWQQYIGKANEASGATSRVAGVIGSAGDHIPEIISSLTTLAELYGIKLVGDVGKFAASMVQSSLAKKEAQAVTERVVLAEKELVSAMAQGGTQTTRYQQARQQLNQAVSQGGAVTAGLANKYNDLQQAQIRATATEQRLIAAQNELNEAMIAGGSETLRYGMAQAGVNAAKQNAQLTTQRLATAQADLNAEVAASGTGSTRAITLQQELNTAKLAATQATARLLAAEAELSAAMAAGGAETQRYATAYQNVTTAQNQASVAATSLQAKTEALTVSTNTASTAASRLEGAFNKAFSAFAGWEIGTMIGEWLNGFESIRNGGSYLSEYFVKLTETVKYFFSGEFISAENGSFSEKMAEITKTFDDFRVKTSDAVIEAEKSTTQHTELLKAQALAVQDSIKQTQDKLKETTDILKTEYKSQTENIKNELDLRIMDIKEYQMSVNDEEEQITKATQEAQEEQLNLIDDFTDKRIELTDKVYKDAIAKTKEGTKEREGIEQQYSESLAQIHQESLAEYQNVVSAMVQSAQNHRDKATKFAEEVLDAEQRKHEGILRLEQIGMTDAEKIESNKKELADRISKYKKMMAAGDYADAKKYSEDTEKLAEKLAESEIDSSGKVTSSAKEKYAEVVRQSKTATEKLRESQDQQAKDLEQQAKSESEKLSEMSSKITGINTELSKKHFLSIDADSSQIDTAIEKINSIPATKDVTININTVNNGSGYSVGGEIQHFATGGQSKFVRREGGLGGYGGGDTVPAMLEAGEWIIKKESVAKYGNGFMAQLNEGKLDIPKFRTGGYVDGVKKKQTGIQKQIDSYQSDLDQLGDGFKNQWDMQRYNGDYREITRLQKELKDTEKELKDAEKRDKEIDDRDKAEKDRRNQIFKQKEDYLKTIGDDIGLENLRYEKETLDLEGNNDALKEAARAHDAQIAKIIADKKEKDDKEAKRIADEKKKAEDEQYNQLYKQKEDYFKSQNDPYSLENLRHEKELRDLAGNDDAIKQSEVSHKAQLEKLDRDQKTYNENQLYKQKEDYFKSTGDDVGLENLRYEKEKQDLSANEDGLKQAEISHKAQLKKIADEKKKKDNEEVLKQDKLLFSSKGDNDPIAQEMMRYREEKLRLSDNPTALKQLDQSHAAILDNIKEKDTFKLKEEGFKLTGDDVGLENLNYEKEKQSLDGNDDALKQAELNHKLRLLKIAADKNKTSKKSTSSSKLDAPSSFNFDDIITDDSSLEDKTKNLARKSQQEFYDAIAKKKADELAKAEKEKAYYADRTSQQNQPVQSGQTITIQFKSPSGSSASGNFTQSNANNLINILREAAASGSTF